MEEYVKSSDMILDIGAHAGEYTVYFSNLNSNASIYSFEQCKDAFETLRQNITECNIQNVVILNHAVGNKLQTSPNTPMLSIDSLQLIRCDFIHINPKQDQHLILQGAKKTIETLHPIICFTTCSKTEQLLLQQTYRILKISDTKQLAYRL